MSTLKNASTDGNDMAVALFELVDAVCGLDRPWDLQGYGIDPRRAEAICEMAEQGKAIYLQRLVDGQR